LRKSGLNPKGSNPETLKRIIKEWNLNTKQMDINRSNLFSSMAFSTHAKVKISLEDIFNGAKPNYQSSKLLKRLVEEGYKEMKCEICGITEWLNKPISLQLHHKDGNGTNNELSNLQILCPNCHSQTDSYAGKSSRVRQCEE
jgi:5-methylcytosine-specific restriction endonuclease McrA